MNKKQPKLKLHKMKKFGSSEEYSLWVMWCNWWC